MNYEWKPSILHAKGQEPTKYTLKFHRLLLPIVVCKLTKGWHWEWNATGISEPFATKEEAMESALRCVVGILGEAHAAFQDNPQPAPVQTDALN